MSRIARSVASLFSLQVVVQEILLDAYPNATAAYSLRKLRTAYTGSAVRVRRSSDNAQLDIGFLPNGDFDEASLLTFVGANSAFVVTWYDQSGNLRNATQATASLQPRIVLNGVIDKRNGKAGVWWDNNDDSLNFTTAIPTGQVHSAFCNGYVQSINAGVDTFFSGIVGSFQARTSTDGSGLYQAQIIRTAVIDILVTGNLTGNAVKNISYFTTATTSNIYVNNVLQASGGTGNFTQPITGLGRSGQVANEGYSDVMHEVVIYTINQSAVRSAIELNQMAYYGVT